MHSETHIHVRHIKRTGVIRGVNPGLVQSPLVTDTNTAWWMGGNDTPWKHQWDYPGIFHLGGLYWEALDCTKTGALLTRQVVLSDYWPSIVKVTAVRYFNLCMLSWKCALRKCTSSCSPCIPDTTPPVPDHAFPPLDNRIARLDNILPECTLAFMGVYSFPRLGNIRLSKQFGFPADPEMIWRNREGRRQCTLTLHIVTHCRMDSLLHCSWYLICYALYPWFSCLDLVLCLLKSVLVYTEGAQ